MDFVTALSTGAKVNFATEQYIYSFIQAVTADPHNWLAKVSHNFVGQCFQVLGLKFNATVESFQQFNYFHPYCEDNLNYVYHVVPFVLSRVEAFLDELPTRLAYYNSQVAQESPDTHLGQQFYDLTNPVRCYLRMVSVWTMVVRVIINKLQLNFNLIDRFICEPLARLSFSLLHGLVRLLPNHGEQFELLNQVCLTLAVLARYGIFYEATCPAILTPMLDIFAEHFQLFCGATKSALNFIYIVLNCEMTNSDSYIQTYKFLISMLDKFADGQQRDSANNLYLRLFTNELITDKYLALQFEMLKGQTNPLRLATLQYLQTLQQHLVSAEIFPLRFLEQILMIVLDVSHVSNAVCSLAAQLYVTLAQRQLHDRQIFVHILELFLKTHHITQKKVANYDKLMLLLKNYIKKLTPYFPAVQFFKSYQNVFSAGDVRLEVIQLAAQALCALFELYTEQYAESELAQKQVHKLLANWPDLLERTAQRPEIRTVIFGIYSVVDFEAIVNQKPRVSCW
ncbi:GH15076 [Drosophila grimshawi]|uniref:GH15076 n=1 Tax=Drosophila grimshawi TaxID=7222 RepID=B4IZB4_DROGR|nr:GH15076 [Drosophila grimshawi]